MEWLQPSGTRVHAAGRLLQSMGQRDEKRRASTVGQRETAAKACGRAGHFHGEGCGTRAAVGRARGVMLLRAAAGPSESEATIDGKVITQLL
jgi:hypothetical protein